MPFVAASYKANPDAPAGCWVCTRTSPLGPYANVPPAEVTGAPHFCGQCVSFVTRVCPSLPVATRAWRKGNLAKGHPQIKAGTVIATFGDDGFYHGHAAIYDSQDDRQLNVYDQWVEGHPTAIHPRPLRFGSPLLVNDGTIFFVVEPR